MRTAEQIAIYKKAWNIRNPIDWKLYHRLHYKKRMLTRLKSRANRNKWEFNLTLNDLVWPEKCPVFGTLFDESLENAVSVDRIDSHKGYTKDNIWFISYRANRIKNDATLLELELLTQALRIQDHARS